MLEGGDAPEGLTLRIIGRRPALGEDVDLHQPIGNALFCQRQPRGTDIDAIGSTEKDRFGDDVLLAQSWPARLGSVGQSRALEPSMSLPRGAPKIWNRREEPVNLVLGACRAAAG